jgi:protein O-GlcNAc transferase
MNDDHGAEAAAAQRTRLQLAGEHARATRFPELLQVAGDILASARQDVETLLTLSALLANVGFLADAAACCEAAREAAPNDFRPLVNLANLARDAGDHRNSRRIYTELQQRLPDDSMIRRNALTSLEYDPDASDAERLLQARAWGEWALNQAGGIRPRPPAPPLRGRSLRVGYLSADFCQHTVGLFVKDVLASHQSSRVTAFAYSAGRVHDWVTDEVRRSCTFRDVSGLIDASLAEQIRQDQLDVLVDLSGHTAGSRLTVLAHRPAPVLVSWLGYFASTGLACIDAVLLDEWHAPPGTEAHFVEPIVRLPRGRFCYKPVPWSPAEVSAAPCVTRGYITFGCFNNTSKLNEGVLDLWAQVLQRVPASRLVLKWHTFNDDAFRESLLAAFEARAIQRDRIELRGSSFHRDLLKEYAEIDIALDPFPFTGGLTSCESLWMGVPVVTWPQGRVVSRQTYAFLSAIGLTGLAAKGAEDYVRIAGDLAQDSARIASLRASLRNLMGASPLMDVAGFTRRLEETFAQLYENICAGETPTNMNTAKTVLHVGPGHRNNGAKMPPAFYAPHWRELRVDIDPLNEPDIVCSMLDMGAIADASVDAIYSSHNIEHVYAHEVPVLLKEFMRVLKPGGFAVITCPDLQSVCALVAQDKLTDTAYLSPAGPIAPLDILYGHGAALAAGHHYMAHKCGFTLKTLTQVLQSHGFRTVAGKRRTRELDLWVVAVNEAVGESELRALAGQMLP